MSSIIKLLPENVANQIAAGEVVQRPSSVIKELLENSVDAGSSNVKLIIKDAGKTLIQVIDDGFGMNIDDLNLCFLRHATSKIRTSKDLFDIGVADLIVDEPNCSAHLDPHGSSVKLKEAILLEYKKLIKLS